MRQGGRAAAGRAFTLVEVALAIAILATVVAVLLGSLVQTARHGKRAADLLAEAVVARTVVTQIRDAIATHPGYLGRLDQDYGFRREPAPVGERWVSFGTVVDRSEPAGTPAGPLRQSPFFRTILGDMGRGASRPGARIEASLPASARLSPGELEDLARSLADFAVRVTVADHIAPMTFLGWSYGDRYLREMMKDVTIDVFRLSEASSGQTWAPAYTITEGVLTPNESLSTDAILDLEDSTRAADLGPLVEAALARLMDDPFLRGYEPAALAIATRIFLVYQEVNVESLRTRGTTLVPLPGVPPGLIGLDQQIGALGGSQSSYLRRKRAALHVEKALVVLQTYRFVRGVLDELQTLHDRFEADLEAARTGLANLLERSRAIVAALASVTEEVRLWALAGELASLPLDATATMEAHRSIIVRARLFEYLLTDPRMVAAVARVREYPSIVRRELSSAADEHWAIAADTEATGLARLRAVHQFVEAATALRIVSGEAVVSPTTSARLAQARRGLGVPIPLLGDYLDVVELSLPWARLTLRYPGFAAQMPAFNRLEGPENPVARVLDRYRPGGNVTGFLDGAATVVVNLYRASLNMAESAGRLGVARARLNEAMAMVIGPISQAGRLAVSLGLTDAATLVGRGRPDLAARRRAGAPGPTNVPVPVSGGRPRGRDEP